MNETCEVNVAPFATSDDDPRYEPCGKPAHYKLGEVWGCAEHYDQSAAVQAGLDDEDDLWDVLED